MRPRQAYHRGAPLRASTRPAEPEFDFDSDQDTAVTANNLLTEAIWYRRYGAELAMAVFFENGGQWFPVAIGADADIAPKATVRVWKGDFKTPSNARRGHAGGRAVTGGLALMASGP
jgi:hypothetical protein